jgi:hypothetical protein
MRGFGRLRAVGVEGTDPTVRRLPATWPRRGKVIEVDRPDRRQRRAKGKSDALDAYAAADAVLSGRAETVPKAGDGITESIRALHTVRSGAIKSRTACINELHALLITASARLREQLAGHKGAGLVQACSACGPLKIWPPPNRAPGTRCVVLPAAGRT